jgi:2-C-methyl-D-erythritol 2,4-cyclodiphosphate synthase
LNFGPRPQSERFILENEKKKIRVYPRLRGRCVEELPMGMRIGYGFDSHAFKAGVPLVIGGLAIEHPEGLAGHSDGDVLLHAITDALLGAVSAGDIGTFFPPSDPRWKGAASSVFLKTALEEVATAGYRIVNIDTVLVMAKPKIVPIAGELRESVAALLGVKPGEVGIKAKTPEGLNQDHVAVAHATVLLESVALNEPAGRMVAIADVEDEIDVVVKGLVGGARDVTALGRKLPTFDTDDLT